MGTLRDLNSRYAFEMGRRAPETDQPGHHAVQDAMPWLCKLDIGEQERVRASAPLHLLLF